MCKITTNRHPPGRGSTSCPFPGLGLGKGAGQGHELPGPKRGFRHTSGYFSWDFHGIFMGFRWEYIWEYNGIYDLSPTWGVQLK